ncbi:uncharacterized protein LOC106666121 [Cimex lectularius]|uniref:Uncharacterized protein n=1 Tax=Cimex lectularius TaxID=79782 RepID=A0A8I6RQZ7_CIMLE|nr:uncharacterized protein LOC106666121 [Cimex lectularius]
MKKNLIRAAIEPQALNLAKDIFFLAEKRVCNPEIVEFIINTMQRLKTLLLEDESSGKFFTTLLISIRKLLINLPLCEVEWSRRFSIEAHLTQHCHEILDGIAKVRIIEQKLKKDLIMKGKKKDYPPLGERSYVQIGIDKTNKIRCILTEPCENVILLIKQAKDFKKCLLEIVVDLESNEKIPEEMKGVIRTILRKFLFSLAIDANTTLKLKKAIYEVQYLVKSFKRVDFDFKFKVRKIQLQTDTLLRDSNYALEFGRDALKRIDFKGEMLDQKLRYSKLLMWPYVGTVFPQENHPAFKCTTFAEVDNSEIASINEY